jgi:hypothetical protein
MPFEKWGFRSKNDPLGENGCPIWEYGFEWDNNSENSILIDPSMKPISGRMPPLRANLINVILKAE